MDLTNLSLSTVLLTEQVKKQVPANELSKLSGKLLYQDDTTATYFVLAQIDKTKPDKPKKKAAKPVGMFSWETVLLVVLWTAFLCLVAVG
jgi:hypothetical protein